MIIQKAVRLIVLLVSAAFSLSGLRATDVTAEPSDAIAKLGDAYVTAFNKGDAKAVAALWTPDGDYVDLLGNTILGRDAIEKSLEAYFAENKGAQLSIDSQTLRFPTPELAIEDGTSAVVPADGGPPSLARFTNTIVLRNGKWELAGVRELPPLVQDRSKELGVLSWLLGTWTAQPTQTESVTVDTAIAPGGNFLISERTTLVKDVAASRGTEWIAWDPASKSVRSWTFDSDGGFGESNWTPTGDNWTVFSVHTLRNGDKVQETQILSPDKTGGVRVSTVSISVNDQPVPKPVDYVFKRPSTEQP